MGDELEVLLFSGGRKFQDQNVFDLTVDSYLKEHKLDPKKLKGVHGKAPGVDMCADAYCISRNIQVQGYPADWKNLDAPGAVIKQTQWGNSYNARAGHDRNAQMRGLGKRLVAFWDGRSTGTREMIYGCFKLGHHVTIFYYDPVSFQIIKTKVLNDDPSSPSDL